MTWTQTNDCTLSPSCGCDYCSARWGLTKAYRNYLETKQVRYLRSIKSLYQRTPAQKRLDGAVDFFLKQVGKLTNKEDDDEEERDEVDQDEDDQDDDEESCDCCAACKTKAGRHDRDCPEHPCQKVDEASRDLCHAIWDELTQLQDQLELVQSAVNVAEGIDGLEKALSGLNEQTGGALVAPSVRPSSALAGRLDQLRGRRDAVQDRLRALGVEAVRRSRTRPAKRRGRRPRPLRKR
jgi:hypothetical protein